MSSRLVWSLGGGHEWVLHVQAGCWRLNFIFDLLLSPRVAGGHCGPRGLLSFRVLPPAKSLASLFSESGSGSMQCLPLKYKRKLCKTDCQYFSPLISPFSTLSDPVDMSSSQNGGSFLLWFLLGFCKCRHLGQSPSSGKKVIPNGA